ncbi:MAG TPA: HyaD/HybD family hydrogenase maturation endopeptidase [Desulfomonilaceae bacterium]|nr:HyaD/HybD family hydrogenase maturation endopeptidase [Desulfomonilaceae bacterium]
MDKIVVLGIGNILLKDEGVGVRVVEQLQRQYSLPENVRVVDGGTQGLWLLSTIQEADHLIVVDAVLGGGEPGTIYRLVKSDLPRGLRFKQSAHDSDLVEALNLCSLIESEPRDVVILGIEPADIQPLGTELTPKVAAKVDELVRRVIDELETLGAKTEKKI